VSRIIFVTGTDTGVGKTLLTGLLLCHLRQSGVDALAMKPFCSGGTADVDLIQSIQGRHPPRKEVNPYYFREPVAPLVAARKSRRPVRLSQVLKAIRRMERRCECLIVEGAGGLLVPLGRNLYVADLIAGLDCDVVVVGRNKLGTINHTLLTLEALRARDVKRIKVVLMEQSTRDISAKSNVAIIQEMAENKEVLPISFQGGAATRSSSIERVAKKIKKTLARISDPDTFSPRSSKRCETKQ